MRKTERSTNAADALCVIRPNKKIDVLPSSRICEYLGRSVRIFFLIIFSKKQPKVPNLGAFSTYFLKKKGEKHPLCQIWAHS